MENVENTQAHTPHEEKEYIATVSGNGIILSYHCVTKGKILRENGSCSFTDVNGTHVHWSGEIMVWDKPMHFETRPIIHASIE